MEFLNHDVRGNRPGRPSVIQPEWLDGRARRFKRGEDFPATMRPEEFARNFRRAAQARKSHGHCKVIGDDLVDAQVE